MKNSIQVALDDIVLDERCQSRAMLNAEAVDDYAELLSAEQKLPPLEVVEVDGDLILVDGFHRLAAARKADHEFIRVVKAEVCDIGRALWLAASKNQDHGVRRTNADKRQATLLALRSDIGKEQSSRIIAKHVGVSKSFVGSLRAELEGGHGGQAEGSEQEQDGPEQEPEGLERPATDIYHTAARRIQSCYKKVCAILGEDDDVCEALYVAVEKAKAREL